MITRTHRARTDPARVTARARARLGLRPKDRVGLGARETYSDPKNLVVDKGVARILEKGGKLVSV